MALPIGPLRRRIAADLGGVHLALNVFVATSVLNVGSVNGINVESILIATVGAIAVIFAARLASGQRGLSHN